MELNLDVKILRVPPSRYLGPLLQAFRRINFSQYHCRSHPLRWYPSARHERDGNRSCKPERQTFRRPIIHYVTLLNVGCFPYLLLVS